MKSQIICGDNVEVLKSLEEKSVHMCVTSPPYWGLRVYEGNQDKQLGLEETPEEYVENLVKVFRGVWRVLRDDGTLWLNIGDSYCGGGRAGGNPDYMAEHKTFGKTSMNTGKYGKPSQIPPGLKHKDLVGIPWRVAFALQADGWYLRNDIIWHKPNPTPSSATDRCTVSHEYMFLLTKKPHYFYDNFVVSEETVGPRRTRRFSSAAGCKARNLGDGDSSEHRYWTDNGRRNKRSVWSIATKPFKGAHSAAYPEALITPPILAGTSEKGCCSVCGEPWRRVTHRTQGDNQKWAQDVNPTIKEQALVNASDRCGHGKLNRGSKADYYANCAQKITVAWSRQCNCGGRETEPCIVLDPFNGAATTSLVARNLGRSYLGIELSPEYCEIANKRLSYDADIITAAEKIKSSDFDDLLI